MQLAHNEKAAETLNGLFACTVNPFWGFREVIAPHLEQLEYVVQIHDGYTNQAFATKLSNTRYEIAIGLVINHTKACRETAYVIIRGIYNTETQRLSKVTANHGSQYTRNAGMAMKLKRTGTVAEVYQQIAVNIVTMLTSEHKGYWAGFTTHYAKKSTNSGYHLD